MTPLTARQALLMDFLRSTFAESGRCPSYDQMAAHIGIKSKSGIHRLLESLEGRGAIRRMAGKIRSIEIVEENSVALNPEIAQLVRDYAKQERVGVDTAANELLRQALGAAG
jgi:repressor LexA